MESMKEMTFDRTGGSGHGMPFGSKYRMLRPWGDPAGEQYLVEDLAGGGKRRIIRIVRDSPPIRSAAEAARRVVHDRILGVQRIEPSEDGRLLIILDSADGETLAARVERLGPMREDRILDHMAAIARAMDQAHAVGVVHGALTSESILLDEDDDAVLLGLSVDAALKAGPETSSEGAAIDPSNDVHAFASVIFTALNGEPPSIGGDRNDVARVGSDDGEDEESVLRRALRRAALRGLDRDPARRPRTCGELMAEVDADIRAVQNADGDDSGSTSGSGRVRTDYATPLDLLDLESAIADLVPRKPRLKIPDHTAVRTAWEKGDHFLSSGAVYKQLQQWQAAGEALERARTEYETALRLDRGLVESRARHQQLAAQAEAMRWADHPQSHEQRDRAGAKLDAERGAWWAAWDEGRLADADAVLDDVADILRGARFDNRSIASANTLRTRWRALMARMPERTLDHRFAEEIRDHRAAGKRADEAFDQGRFDAAGGIWSTRVDRLSESLDQESHAHTGAVDARSRFDEAIGRTPKSRPMSAPLRTALDALNTESERIEKELFGVGRFTEAAAAWATAAASIGRLIQEDVERFGRMESAREAYARLDSMKPKQRAVWTRLTPEGAAIHGIVGQAVAAREKGDFDTASDAWTQAARRFQKALALDADRHREALLAIERLDRKLGTLPHRMLDRSVRAEIERILKRRPIFNEWMKTGRFTEVEETVNRTIEIIDKTLAADALLYDAAVTARDQAATFIVDMPAEVPELVHLRMKPAATEIDATAVQARQAFELGEYVDCAEAWRKNIQQRRQFAEDMRQEIDRFMRQQQRTALIRSVGAVVTVTVVLAVVLGVASLIWMNSVADKARSPLPAMTPQALKDRQQQLITRADEVSGNIFGFFQVVTTGIELNGQINQMLQDGDDLQRVGVALDAIDVPVVEGEMPEKLQRRLQELLDGLETQRDKWQAMSSCDGEFASVEKEVGALEGDAENLRKQVDRATQDRESLKSLATEKPAEESTYSEVKEAWITYQRDLDDAWKSWGDGNETSLKQEMADLTRLAAANKTLQQKLEALSAEKTCTDVLKDCVAVRGSTSDKDLDRLQDDARDAFAKEQYATAKVKWEEASKLARNLCESLTQGADEYQKLRDDWKSLLAEQPQPTEWVLTEEKSGLKTYFDQADKRAKQARDAEMDRDYETACDELSKAIEKRGEALERLEEKIRKNRKIAGESGQTPGERLLALDWLINALPEDDPERADAVRQKNEIQWIAEAPADRDVRSWHIDEDRSIEMVFVKGTNNCRIDGRRLTVSDFWISLDPVDPAILKEGMASGPVDDQTAFTLARSLTLPKLPRNAVEQCDWYSRIPTDTEWDWAKKKISGFKVVGDATGEWVWDRPAPADAAERGLRWSDYLATENPGGPEGVRGRVFRDRAGFRQEDPEASGKRGFRLVFSPVREPRPPDPEEVKRQENPRLAGKVAEFVDESTNRRTITLGNDGPSIEFV
ncbi:MAG: hypothetical protein RLZZ461_362, partial [Planctomycetota bacterium]